MKVNTEGVGFLKEYMQEKFREVNEEQKEIKVSLKDASNKIDNLGVEIRANYVTQKMHEELKSDLKGLKAQLYGIVGIVLTYVIGQILIRNFPS